jgi:hypothetical protein
MAPTRDFVDATESIPETEDEEECARSYLGIGFLPPIIIDPADKNSL